MNCMANKWRMSAGGIKEGLIISHMNRVSKSVVDFFSDKSEEEIQKYIALCEQAELIKTDLKYKLVRRYSLSRTIPFFSGKLFLFHSTVFNDSAIWIFSTFRFIYRFTKKANRIVSINASR